MKIRIKNICSAPAYRKLGVKISNFPSFRVCIYFYAYAIVIEL